MKMIDLALGVLVVALCQVSCVTTLGDHGTVNKTTLVGYPKRVEKIFQTREGYAVQVVYQNKEAVQTLVITTDASGGNPKFARQKVDGVSIPFEARPYRASEAGTSFLPPGGRYPYGLVTEWGKERTPSVQVLISPEDGENLELPTHKPDWAGRIFTTPGAILRDVALAPLLVPAMIVLNPPPG